MIYILKIVLECFHSCKVLVTRDNMQHVNQNSGLYVFGVMALRQMKIQVRVMSALHKGSCWVLVQSLGMCCPLLGQSDFEIILLVGAHIILIPPLSFVLKMSAFICLLHWHLSPKPQ